MTSPLILAYYFPDWHQDSRNQCWFGAGWDEWTLLRSARPRFDGHRQPRVPLDGYLDEADPAEAARQIELAHNYGIDGFLVDYYWYDDGPYLSDALDRGILKAPNRNDIKFALMWANHELLDIFPFSHKQADVPSRLKDGAIDRAAFERMVNHIIEAYFKQPNYLKIDGRPWFSMYEVGNFIEGMGGVEAAREALDWFRSRVQDAGFSGLHLDAVVFGFSVLPTEVAREDINDIVGHLGFDSATSYVWIHHVDVSEHDFPLADSDRLRREAFSHYEELARTLRVPFYPNVTVGWDSTPRASLDSAYIPGRYPFSPVWDQTPEQFEDALRVAADFIKEHPHDPSIITINAWNEWTEGSYLLPDTDNGYRYLEAVRKVFGDSK